MDNTQKKSWAGWAISGGAVVGGILTTWLAPSAIAWWFKPPANIGINCSEPIEWALHRLQWTQLAGILFGALIGLIIYLRFRPQHS